MEAGGEMGKRIGREARILQTQIRMGCGHGKCKAVNYMSFQPFHLPHVVPTFPVPRGTEENRHVQVYTQFDLRILVSVMRCPVNHLVNLTVTCDNRQYRS